MNEGGFPPVLLLSSRPLFCPHLVCRSNRWEGVGRVLTCHTTRNKGVNMGGFDNLGISLPLLLAFVINFIILLALLGKFLYKPVLKTLDERAQS